MAGAVGLAAAVHGQVERAGQDEAELGMSKRRASTQLVAQVDERHHRPRASAQRELEEAAVPLERLLDVRDLESDVDADEPRHPGTLAARPV